eukprot:TRINITY_DN65733_c5_g2_i2.p1 TRINITY_DN65733_c5_g2~~TRINITY_DN65733_c5_g2_i2.p1  ORF type:complete len:486 (+),score=257.55 TRINITY_DN65733_c5_g2_i2:137-1594(+)
MAPQNPSASVPAVPNRKTRPNGRKWPEYTMEEVSKHDKDGDLWVAIDGKVYNLSNWAEMHPGGKLALLGLAGRDATDPYLGFHPVEVTEKRLPRFQCGIVKDYEEDPLQKELQSIRRKLQEEGMYDTTVGFYVKHAIFEIILWLASVYTLSLANASYRETSSLNLTASAWYVLSAGLMGMFWQQNAFIGHDLGHNSVTHVRDKDWIGSIIVTACFGVSGQWWKRNHNFHHLVTNSVDWDPDIQHLPVLAVTKKAFNGYFSKYYERYMNFDAVSAFIIAHQHYLYYVVMGVARWNLYLQSLLLLLNPFKKVRGRAIELASVGAFWLWFIAVVRTIPAGSAIFLWIMVSHAIAGIIHVQITLSHFAMDTYMGRTYKKEDLQHFVRMQLATTMNVDCPWWMDWFHGGLQFQVEHHLLPRCSRENLRYAMEKYIRPMCAKYGIEYHIYPFIECNKIVINCLREAAMEARAHPKSKNLRNYLWDVANAEG